MTIKSRRKHTPAFKTKVALEAVLSPRTVAELHELPPRRLPIGSAPAIFNTDQGSQFTSEELTQELQHHGIRISMDGKGAWRDNVFVERLWRSIKCEKIYLKACGSVLEARQGSGSTSISAMQAGLIQRMGSAPQMRCLTNVLHRSVESTSERSLYSIFEIAVLSELYCAKITIFLQGRRFLPLATVTQVSSVR